jgi:hypothetical protein
MLSTSSSSSSMFIPAEDKRELHRSGGWKRHAAWVILGLAFLLGSGTGGSVAARLSRGQPIFTPHIALPAIGRVAGRTTASSALAETGSRNWSTTGNYIDGGPPIP